MTLSTIFVLLFLASVPLFILGMIRPSALKFLTRKVLARKTLLLLIPSIGLVCLILAFAVAPTPSTTTEDSVAELDQPNQEVVDTSNTETTTELDSEIVAQVDSKFIPGITAADVKLNFTDKGFTCDGPRAVDDQYLGFFILYSCEFKTDEYEYRVEFDGESVTDILSVQGIVLNYGQRSLEEVATEFLGYVATLPYEGSNPEEAKVWAQQNIGVKTEIKIGGVTFDSAGTERSAILTISR